MGLTSRPPLQHLERGWIPAFAGMTGGAGAMNRAPTAKTYPCQRVTPPYGPPAAAGGHGFRLSPE